MCGIIGVTGTADKASLVLEGLRSLEYRGYDSAGLACIDASAGLIWRAREAEQKRSVENLEKRLEDFPACAGAAIGHTRWATHGAPVEENAHPHLDCSGHLAVVHNGIIENHRSLEAELRARGHHFTSHTDTEVVAHLLEEEQRAGASLSEAMRHTMGRLRGDFALAVISSDEPQRIVAARHTSPLILGRSESLGLLASDVAALLPLTRELYQLEDGEIAVLEPGSVRVLGPNGAEEPPRRLEVTWDVAAAQKGGYPDFMSKEMREQPGAVAETLLGRIGNDGATAIEELSLPSEALASVKKVLYVACGSSYHAAYVARLVTESWARVPAEADIASEFRYRDPIVDEGTLLVAVSQSGETADTLHALREARAKGATTIALTNVVDSVMTREADAALYTHAGPEIGVASTKCHLAQLALLEAFALHLARARGALEEARARELAAGLVGLPDLIAQTLARADDYCALARRYASVEHFYFLGRRTGYPIALEGALKLKELAYVRAEAYPAGEMKHGPISLLQPGSVVLAVATAGSLREKVLANIEECRARGATVLALVSDGDTETEKHVDGTLSIPAVEEALSPLVGVVPLQFFAYTVARERGNDVDRPRNLAKVVTVE